jgi:hypothetical protein
MMARRSVLGVLAGGAAVLLSGCDVNSPVMGWIWEEPYFAKLNVEIDTPAGVKSGYSVIEVKWGKSGQSFNVRGEAVAVDLPTGQTLFVLLQSPSSVDWAARLHDNIDRNALVAGDNYYLSIAGNRSVWPVRRTKEYFGNKELHDNYPYFVRFKDIKDPKTVERVDPDDLSKSFGPGYRLRSFTLQMTDEPVTEGIAERLPKPPYIRNFVYEGEDSEALNLYKGKKVSEVIGIESFRQGFAK